MTREQLEEVIQRSSDLAVSQAKYIHIDLRNVMLDLFFENQALHARLEQGEARVKDLEEELRAEKIRYGLMSTTCQHSIDRVTAIENREARMHAIIAARSTQAPCECEVCQKWNDRPLTPPARGEEEEESPR